MDCSFQFWHHLSEHHSSLVKLTQTHLNIYDTLHIYFSILHLLLINIQFLTFLTLLLPAGGHCCQKLRKWLKSSLMRVKMMLLIVKSIPTFRNSIMMNFWPREGDQIHIFLDHSVWTLHGSF